MIGRRRRSRGQATLELALIAPVLFMLMLGATDLAQAFYLNIDTGGAARAGMRAGVTGNSVLGEIIRQEPAAPNAQIQDTHAIWGNTALGQTNGCDGQSGQKCGDPHGCQSSGANNVFNGAVQACFAVADCPKSGSGYGCTLPGSPSWGTMPATGSGDGLYVKVVYEFTPSTPLIAHLAGSSGSFFLTGIAIGEELP